MITEQELASTNITMRYELAPSKNLVGDLSGLIGNFCDEFIGSFYPRAISKKANIVITELFNNAVENNIDGDSRITLELRINREALWIRVMNAADRRQYRAVREQVRKIRRSQDPKRLLAETIRSRRKDRLPGGLGLIRLAAENKFQLAVRYRAPYLIVESQIGLGGLL